MVPLCHARKGIHGTIPDCNVSKDDSDPTVWLMQKLGRRQGQQKLAALQRFFDAALAHAQSEKQSA